MVPIRRQDLLKSFFAFAPGPPASPSSDDQIDSWIENLHRPLSFHLTVTSGCTLSFFEGQIVAFVPGVKYSSGFESKDIGSHHPDLSFLFYRSVVSKFHQSLIKDTQVTHRTDDHTCTCERDREIQAHHGRRRPVRWTRFIH